MFAVDVPADGDDERKLMTDTKPELRAAALARRDALSDADRAAAAMTLAATALPIPVRPGIVLAGYSPIRGEIDPGPLMETFLLQGARLALPVIVARDAPLAFRLWSPGQRLQRGSFGILEPSRDATEADPDILLVPLAAFDRNCHRIGYGAGFYDRSLADLRAKKALNAIGLAFAVQEVDVVPHDRHDQPLDYVLTEREIIHVRSG